MVVQLDPHTVAYIRALKQVFVQAEGRFLGPPRLQSLLVHIGPDVLVPKHVRTKVKCCCCYSQVKLPAHHKARYFTLLDFSMHPGFGVDLDRILGNSTTVLLARHGSEINSYSTVPFVLSGGEAEADPLIIRRVLDVGHTVLVKEKEIGWAQGIAHNLGAFLEPPIPQNKKN